MKSPNRFLPWLWLVLLCAFVNHASALVVTRTSATNVFYIDSSNAPQLTSAYASYLINNNLGVNYSNVWVKIDSFTGGVVQKAANEDGEYNLGTLLAGQTKPAFFYLSASGETAGAQGHSIKVYQGHPSVGTLLMNQTFSFRSVASTISANANKVNTIVYGPEPPTLGGIVTIVVDGDSGTIGSGKVLSFSPASFSDWRADSYEMVGSEITLSVGNTGSFTNTLLIPASALASTANTHYQAVYKFRAVGVTQAPTVVSPVGYISSGTQIKHTSTGNFGGFAPIVPAVNTTLLSMLGNTNQLYAADTITYTVRLTNSGTNAAFFDRFVNTLPAGVSYVAGSAAYNGISVGVPAVSGQALTWYGYFDVPASSSRDLVLQATFSGTPGRYTNAAVAFTQSAQIDTTLDTTDNAPATYVVRVFGPNIAPVANNDADTTLEDVAVVVDVVANDVDENLDLSSVDLDTVTAGQQTSISTAQGNWLVDANGLVTFTPAAGVNGVTARNYTVKDLAGLQSGVATITITVTAVNDAPTLNALSALNINEDATLQTVNLSGISRGGGTDEATQTVVVTAASSDTSLIPNPAVSYTSGNPTGSLTFTPVANAFGSATVTVVVQDSGGISNGGQNAVTNTFLVVVNPVNDVPSFTKGADVTRNVTGGAQTLFAWATSISPGPANEVNDVVSFVVTNSNNGLFSVQPAINTLGTLTFTPSGTVGTATVTVRLQDNGGTLNGGVNLSAAQTFVITMSSAGVIPATGGGAISATTAAPSTAWTVLTGPIYRESTSSDVGVGTVILNAPAGFEFDTTTTAGPLPTVVITRLAGSGPNERNINGVASGTVVALTSITTTTMTLTISKISELQGGVPNYCSLTWQNVRVRPTAGSPLANGKITKSGTSTMNQVTAGVTSFGDLVEIAGPAAGLQIFAQPSSTATAGQQFLIQPIIRIVDASGNWLFTNNTAQVTVARFSGSGTLQGTLTLTAVNGEVRYTNLFHLIPGTINLQFTSPGLSSVTSGNIVIGAGAAAKLGIATQPSPTAVAGVNFGQQPVIRIEDASGNLVTSSTAAVTVVRNSGSGTLQGTTTVNAVAGIATFTNLNHRVSGTINLQFSSPTLNSTNSQNIVISAGPATQMVLVTQPSTTATAGVAFVQQPVIQIKDQYGNLVTSDNTTQITVARNFGPGTLQGTTTVTAVGGIVTFSGLNHRVAGIIDLIFTSNTGLPAVISNDITIQASTPAALAIEAQPSSRATVNTAFQDQPVIIIVDAYGNWVSTDNSSQITVIRSAGSGTLQGTTTLTASGGIVSYGNLSHPTLGTINLLFSSPGLTSVTSQNVVITPFVSQLLFTTQPSNAQVNQSIGNVVVQLADAGGVSVAASGVPITLAMSSGDGLLNGTLVLFTDASGKVTYNNLSVTARGTKRLEASSDTLIATSASFIITGVAPTLTSVNTLSGGTEDLPLTITYASLVASGNEFDSDGDTLSFRIEAITSGTLTKNGVPVIPGVTLIGPGDELVWTPASNANGPAVNAFTVKAYDGEQYSSSAVQVSAAVAAVNDAPTLTTVNQVTGGPEGTAVTITYAMLAGLANEADVDGDTVSFRFDGLTTGTLTKNGVPVVPEDTLLGVGEQWIWTPAPNQSGSLNAFTVKAFDGILASAAAVQVQVSVTAVDDPPQISFVTTLAGAYEDTPFTITYVALAAAADESDPEGDVISFRVESINGGTLTKNGVAVQNGITLLQPGDTWVWTPPANANGALEAFTIKAHDGDSASTNAVQVTVAVSPVNDVPAFTKGSDIAVNQGASLQTYAGWVSNITTGPADESDQTVTFIVSNNNNAIFGTQPAISRTGKLIFAPNGTSGSATVTVQIQDNGGTANGGQNTSGSQTFQIIFSEAGLSPASGGAAISADTTGGSWTSLNGPTYEENTPGDVGVGTFIVNVPGGFEFDTSGVAPRVLITRDEGTGADSRNINGVPSGTSLAMTAVSSTQLTFTITSASTGDVECLLTWQNIRVRPTAGSPLAAGNMVKTGTSLTYQVTDNVTSLGGLEMVTGAATRLQIATQPSPTATAGVSFFQQPVVWVVDQFGNVITDNNTTSVTVARKDGAGTLLGTTTLTVTGGIVDFTNLSHTVAGTITLEFTAAGLTPATSGNVVIAAAAADHIAIGTQPSPSAIAGAAFAQQPVIRVEDVFGNLVTSDNITEITVARNSGSGTLQGTKIITVVGGVATYTDLNHTVAGTIDLLFTGPGFTSVTSQNVVIGHGAAVAVVIDTQPSPAATAGVAFVQQPVLRLIDAFGNTVTSDNSTQVTASRNAGSGTLLGTTTVTVIAGVATYANLQHNVSGTIDLDFNTSTALPTVTSDDIVISPSSANKLALQTQPSANATAGIDFTQQPVIRIEDAFGNLITTDNTSVITVSVFSGNGTLQGTLTGTAVNGIVTFTDLHHLVAGQITLRFTTPGLTSVVSNPIDIAAGAAAAIEIVTQPSPAADAGVAFAQQPVVRLVDAYGNPVTTDNSTQITVARDAGFGTLQGTKTMTVVAGVATFTNLYHLVPGTIDLGFSSAGLNSVVSEEIVVTGALASRLTIQTQPSPTATAGVAFAAQPVIRIEDEFGNLVISDSTTQVTVTRNAGSGTLLGTLTITAVNGIATFTNLYHTVSGTIDLTFTSNPVLTPATSTSIVISPATANRLAIQTQPAPSATAGAPFAQQPVIRIEDQYGNLVAGDNTTQITVSRNNGAGTLQGTLTVSVVNGIAAFADLYHTVTGTIDLGFTSIPSLLPVDSEDVVIAAGAAHHMAIQAQPSATADAGQVFAQQPVVRIEDQFGNLRASDNTTQVTGARLSGSGTLQGTLTKTVVNGVATFTGLYHNQLGVITLSFNSNPALPQVESSSITIRPGVAVRLTFADQPALETTGVVFVDQPVIRAVDSLGNYTTNVGNLTVGNTSVMLTLVGGSGILSGTVAHDITSVPGIVTGLDLQANMPGTNWQLVATNNILGAATSAVFTVVSPSTVPAPFGTNGAPHALLTGDAGPIGLWLANLRGNKFPWYTSGIGLIWRDLVVANYDANIITVRLCNDNGTFQPPITYPTGPNPFAVRSAFISHHVFEDVAVANFGTNTVSIFQSLRDGSGTLLPKVDYVIGSTPNPGPISVASGHFSGSGFADLFIANSNECTVSVLRNMGGTFVLHTNLPVGLNPMSVHAADFDGDKVTDIVTANKGDGTLSLFRGQTNLTFVLWKTITLAPGGNPMPSSAMANDINGDGRPDIAVANANSNTVSIVLQDASNNFSVFASYAVGSHPRSVLLRDLNRDGFADVTVANYEGASVDVLLGKGDGTFISGGRIPVGRNPMCIVGSNFNGDSATDLAVSNFGDDTISLFLYSGPLARNMVVSTLQNQAVNITLRGELLDGASIAYTLLTQPLNGTLSGTPPNLVYTPDTNFSGVDSFEYSTLNTNYNGPDRFQYETNTGVFSGSIPSIPATVTITIKPANQAPSFVLSTNRIIVPSSAPIQTNANMAINISTGGESDQTLSFLVAVTNASFYSVNPTLSANGTLIFRPSHLAVGTNTLSIRLQDSGSTANGGVNVTPMVQLQIVVLPNNAPSFNLASNLVQGTTFAPMQNVPNFATAISAGLNEAGQTLTFLLSNTNSAFFAIPPSITANGNLTFAPAWTATGTNYVSVLVRDSGSTNGGGINLSATRTFAIAADGPINPFITSKSGTYNGLFSESTGVTHQTAGYLTMKVSPSRGFSGKLFVDGNPVSFSGKFNVDGTGIAATKGRALYDKNELLLTFALNITNDTMTGAVSDLAWTAQIVADRLIWTTNLTEQATQFTNSYTMVLPGFTNRNDGPVGNGYATVALDKLGRIRASGATADGQPMKQTSYVSKNGDWPMYSPGYKISRLNSSGVLVYENKGFVLGWLTFSTNAYGYLAPSGDLSWIKTGWTNATYSSGFTNNGIEIVGSRWLAPALGSATPAVAITNALLSFTDGDLGANLFNASFRMTTNTTLVLPAGVTNLNTTRVTLTPKTGLFKGYFVHPSGSILTRYAGVLLQDYHHGRGYFMGSTEGGTVELESAD